MRLKVTQKTSLWCKALLAVFTNIRLSKRPSSRLTVTVRFITFVAIEARVIRFLTHLTAIDSNNRKWTSSNYKFIAAKVINKYESNVNNDTYVKTYGQSHYVSNSYGKPQNILLIRKYASAMLLLIFDTLPASHSCGTKICCCGKHARTLRHRRTHAPCTATAPAPQ